jgi:signal transduction histidine kinase
MSAVTGVLGAPFGRRQRGEFGLALVGLIPGVVGGLLVLALLSVGAVLTVVNVGLVLLVGVLTIVRGLSVLHRRLLRGLLDERIPPPQRAPVSRFAAARRLLTSSDSWRAVAYVLLNIPLSVLLFVVLVGFRFYGFAFLTYPLWWWLMEGGGERGIGVVGELRLDTWPLAFVASLVGIGVLGLSTWGGGRLVALVLAAARALLGPAPLSARVRALEETRSLAVADSAAALRRIERDLHDGAQARLVALAMSLTMVKEKLSAPHPPLDQLRELVDGALRGARTAIQELRELVRGIHPPMLDVGLAEALESLVSDNVPPVTVDVRLRGRPSPAIETIAYFCAAELVANATRHGAAAEIAVTVRQDDQQLMVTVRDDGRGGAVVGAGSGLAGLVTRIRPVDGDLELESPPGGPTTVVVRLPLDGIRS